MILSARHDFAVEAGSTVSASVAEPQGFIVSAGADGISNYARWGDDLIVEMPSGGSLRINNFFINGPAFHRLTLVKNGVHLKVDLSHALVNDGDGIADERIIYQPVSASLSVTKLLGILGGTAAGAAGLAAAIAHDSDDSQNGRPERPAFEARNDGNGNENSDPVVIANEGHTNDNTPTLDGKGAVPGGTIIIRGEGREPVFITVAEDGSWSYTFEPALDDGEYDIRISQRDKSGRISDDTSLKFTVDTAPPETPALEKAEDQVSPDAPVWDEEGQKWAKSPEGGVIEAGGITNDATPVFSGRGEPGATIKIYDKNGKVVGSGVVDEDGRWSVIPENNLPDGPNELYFTATDQAGNESEKSPVFEIIIDTRAPDKLDINGIVLEDAAGNVIENETGKTDSSRPVFHGRVGGAEAVWIEILSGNTVVGLVCVKDDGTWKWQADSDLRFGWHHYRFRAVDAAGNVGPPSDEYRFEVTEKTAAETDHPVNDQSHVFAGQVEGFQAAVSRTDETDSVDDGRNRLTLGGDGRNVLPAIWADEVPAINVSGFMQMRPDVVADAVADQQRPVDMAERVMTSADIYDDDMAGASGQESPAGDPLSRRDNGGSDVVPEQMMGFVSVAVLPDGRDADGQGDGTVSLAIADLFSAVPPGEENLSMPASDISAGSGLYLLRSQDCGVDEITISQQLLV